MSDTQARTGTRWIFAALIGGGGVLILLYLGIWQIQRLAWKEALLADIGTRIAAAPVDLPATPDREADRYLPVTVTGQFTTETAPAKMLASRRQTGAVYRVLAPFETAEDRRVMIDLGWIPAERDLPDLPQGPVTLTGNLDWPRETDGFTPEPDLDDGLWYARDVAPLAEVFETEEILLVLRERPESDLDVTPWPVDTSNIPNDHLQYALTWFSLAVIWVGMTIFFLRRQGRRVTR